MTEGFTYEGADLEAMDTADNYHRWILDGFEAALGPRVVEVGAGIGSLARLIAERSKPQALLLVEPSSTMACSLAHNAEVIDVDARAFTGFLADAEDRVREFSPTTFVYVNVLEHIEDDIAELARVFELLPAGGTLCVFVPALPFLFSDFDRSIGHFRRYGRSELEQKVSGVGFSVDSSRYFDLLGVLPWLVRYRLFGSRTLSPGSVALYDKWIVPSARRLERLVSPPLGKNLLLTAHKP